MYFIILSTASPLFKTGTTDINTAAHGCGSTSPVGSEKFYAAIGIFTRSQVGSRRHSSRWGQRNHFLEELFLEERFFVDRFLPAFFEPFFDPFFDPLRGGTFAPASRASESPIAIACFLLVTFLPERPLFKVPCLRSCIARSTFSLAFLPYLAICNHLLDHLYFRVQVSGSQS